MNSTLLQIHEDASETKETGANLAAKLATSNLHQIKMSRLIPPPYQRRNLPLQATQAISQHTDTLFALRDISQNLPSKVSALLTVAVTKTVRSAVEALYNVIPSLSKYVSSRATFINGRPIPVVVNDNAKDKATKRVRMIFQEEMMILAEMVQEHRLTDDKPRSVYGTYLACPAETRWFDATRKNVYSFQLFYMVKKGELFCTISLVFYLEKLLYRLPAARLPYNIFS